MNEELPYQNSALPSLSVKIIDFTFLSLKLMGHSEKYWSIVLLGGRYMKMNFTLIESSLWASDIQLFHLKLFLCNCTTPYFILKAGNSRLCFFMGLNQNKQDSKNQWTFFKKNIYGKTKVFVINWKLILREIVQYQGNPWLSVSYFLWGPWP